MFITFYSDDSHKFPIFCERRYLYGALLVSDNLCFLTICISTQSLTKSCILIEESIGLHSYLFGEILTPVIFS